MNASNYRRFPMILLTAGSLIARAEEVQRMEAVESTASEDKPLSVGTRVVPAREAVPPRPIRACCWKISRARASCATGI
jgi:hypothetical protein